MRDFNDYPVIYITSDERARNYTWYDDSKKLLDSNIGFVSINTIPDLQKQGISFPLYGDLMNKVLFRNPYDKNQFFLADEAPDKISEIKFNNYVHIAQILGARKTSIKIKEVTNIKRDINADGAVSAKFLDVKCKLSQNSEEQTRLDRLLLQTNQGSEVDQLDFDYVNKYVSERAYLKQDPFVVKIIDARNPIHKNLNKELKYEYKFYNESNNLLDIAAKLTYMKAFNFDNSFTSIVKKSKEITVELFIEFGEA